MPVLAISASIKKIGIKNAKETIVKLDFSDAIINQYRSVPNLFNTLIYLFITFLHVHACIYVSVHACVCVLRSFFKVKVQNWEYFLGLLKFQIFFGGA